MIKQILENLFPNLKLNKWAITSPRTQKYNCIAWAAEDTTRWWWPHPAYYWPPNAPQTNKLNAFIKAFETLGYVRCKKSDKFKNKFIKIAIYTNQDGNPTHAARQIKNGFWTSKLGEGYDIVHSYNSLCNSKNYGDIAVVMKKRIEPSIFIELISYLKKILNHFLRFRVASVNK